ncbi:TadE/TadG family type IV pilus assembly protein [Salipiger bermudensis]|uniref:TadE/TadG family type IV pilus assembly protein n=1 Tax=Salipiger bermudensis TaxID=344736 RepID=UPI001CD7B225|nr:hypothetical protein [Salipiger bermudensis]MCA1287368.1 hypothetical protein [Salipiger bermudensis]
MNTTTIKTLLRKFRRDNEGYVTIEVMFMLPVLFVLFGAAWVYFDVFRQQSVNQKANYAIGDMLSRETEEIDDTFIDNSFKLFGVLTKNVTEPDELTGRYSADLRITVVEYNANSRKYSVVWSAARGEYEELTGNEADNYANRLPVMANNGQVIMVEASEDYYPIFNVGLDPLELKTYSFTHPRYAPQVLFAGAQGENNGWGNGDQDAPGESLCNNNAENATDCSNEDGSNNIEPNRGHGRG